jgi:prophage antirepressor-like protein
MLPQVFQYKQNAVRVAKIDDDGTPWFVAKDVCDVLGVSNSRASLAFLDDDEKGVTLSDTPGGQQELSTVNEAGLYSLILRSRKPEAKVFKRWVTHEVLPQIRKTGRYDIASRPMTEFDAMEANARSVVHLFGQLRENRKVAAEALVKATENAQEIATLSRVQHEMLATQLAVRASIPLLPEPTVPVQPRSMRSNVVELLRATAIQTGASYQAVASKAYRELKYRDKVDIMQRARNLKQQGQSKVTGLDVVEQLGLTDRFYALCVELFGRPTNPLPNVPNVV